jgi:hypothetical protein
MRCARERLADQVARWLVCGVRLRCTGTAPTAGGGTMPLDGVQLLHAPAGQQHQQQAGNDGSSAGPMELYYAAVFASEHIVP